MQRKQAVLMSVISGDAVSCVRDMEDKQVADECMKVLRELFKEQVIIYFLFITRDELLLCFSYCLMYQNCSRGFIIKGEIIHIPASIQYF